MSTLTLAKGALKSRIIRKTLTGNDRFRVIDASHPIIKKDDNGNWLKPLFNAGKFVWSVVEWLFNTGTSIVTSIYTWIHQRWTELSNFNWNSSDKQLELSMKTQQQQMYSIWGGVIGQIQGTLVAITVGAGISFLLPVIGGAGLAKAVATKVATERADDLIGAIKGAIISTFNYLAKVGVTSLYINYRKTLKSIDIKYLEAIYGKDKARWIKDKWGNEGEPEMSYRKWQEEEIEEIQDPNWRAFHQARTEEAEESFWETGYIIAHTIDNAYEQAKLANLKQHGKRRTVKITPDKRIKTKTEGQIVLTGTEQELRSAIPEVLAQHRMLVNKDLGVVVGLPAEDFAIAKVLRRQLVLVFKSKESPPWTATKNGKRETAREVEVTIPDVSLGLSWDKIKRLCRPWQWGAFKCWVKLDNGRIMTVYGSSKKTAETKMKDFLQLTTANVLSWHYGEEGDKKNVRLKKKPTQVYPAYGTLLVRKPTAVTSRTANQTGKAYEDGSVLEEQLLRFDLWVDQQPDNYTPLN